MNLSHLHQMSLRSLTFDHLAASGALLDGTGRVIDTNAAWRLFAELNGAEAATVGEGVDYLAVCERAAALGDATAAAAHAGLVAVLAGDRARFDLEYACIGPDEDRWFQLTAVAAPIADLSGVVVMHADVTARKLVEQGLAEQRDIDGRTGLGSERAAAAFLRRHVVADGPPVAAVVVGLHDLASVDDRFGPTLTDEVVVQVASRIRRLQPAGGLACAVDRDQLLLVHPGAGDREVRDLVDAMAAVLARPVQLGPDSLVVDAAVRAISSTQFPSARRLLAEAKRRSAEERPRRSSADLVGGTGTDPGTPAAAPVARRRHALRTDPTTLAIAELRAAQATTNAVLARATDLVLFFLEDGTIVWASPACRRLYGVEPETLVGANGIDLVHPDDRRRVFRDFRSIPDLGDSVRTEFRVIDGDQQVRWVEEVITNLLDEPDVGTVVGHLRDITERKEAESEVRLQARLLAAVGQAVVARDAGGVIIYWNSAAESLYGWSPEEAVGRRLSYLVPPAEGWSDRSLEAGRHFAEGRRWSGELCVVTKGGVEVPVLVTATPVADEEGRLSGTIIVSADLSEEIASRATAARLAAVVESSTDAIISADVRGIISTWNSSAADLFGLRPEAAIGTALRDLLPERHAQELDRAVQDVVVGARVGTVAVVVERSDDTTFHASISLSPIAAPSGGVAGVSMIVRDVTESIEGRIRADRDRQRLADAQASAGLGSFEIDLRTGEVARSDELWRILGREPGSDVDLLSCVHTEDEDAVGAAFAALSEGRSAEPVTHRIVRPDGEIRWVLSRVTQSRSASHRLSGTSLDITELQLTKLALADQAHHDPLTGLANRRLLMDRLESALDRDRETGRRTAVLFIDLDDFKKVNDRIGHHGGDRVLQATGELLDGFLEGSDTVARLGGDEFVVCCADIDDVWEVHRTVRRIQAALSAPFRSQGESFAVTCSIGVAVSGPGSLADVLLRDADAAMYAAKQRGPGRVEIFDRSMNDEVAHRRARIAELASALAAGQIHTHFQPEVELDSGQLIGFEALVRWVHPERGLVGPGEFIELAETSGLIHDLGRLVLADACAAMATWMSRHPEQKLTVSVNISPVQIASPTLPDDVRAAIAGAGVPPGRICLEVTETALMDSEHAAEVLRTLKEIGVLIAIDDFGTGYSSLSRLKRFPVDFLKIDRTFVDGLGRDPEDELIVAAVTDLAHSMGIQVIAEGIETTTQLQMLARMRCEFGQGFRWSPAVPLDDLWPMIDGRRQLEHAPGMRRTVSPEGDGAWGRQANTVSDAVSLLVHELGTPLTVAGGYAAMLRESPDVEDGSETALRLEAIGRAVRDMAAITASLADARPLAEGTVALDRQEVDVVPLLLGLIDTSELPGSIDDLLHGATSAAVWADPSRLRQIFRNLLANASKWQASRTWIQVHDDPASRVVTVSVLDDGPGVPADRVGDLFRRFSQLDSSRPGTGLGLYVARTLARAHGGEVRYHRTADGGSEFAVELPRPPAPR